MANKRVCVCVCGGGSRSCKASECVNPNVGSGKSCVSSGEFHLFSQ